MSANVLIQINGSDVDLPVDARVSLLDLLRETLHLHGTKKGCNQGARVQYVETDKLSAHRRERELLSKESSYERCID